MTDKEKQTLKENCNRKTIFMILEILAIIGLFKELWQIATCATLLLVIFVGNLLFRLVDEINKERA